MISPGPTTRMIGTRARVLVLMATFNGADWIEEQLRSVLAQRDVDLDVSIRDDASADDTVARARAVPVPSGSVSIVRAERPGGSAAKNFFALMTSANASGHDFVALSDQDDVWDRSKLARAVDCLKATGAAGYSSGVRAFWPDGRTRLLPQNTKPTLADYLFEGGGQGCTYVLRSDVFARLQAILVAQTAMLRGIHYHDWTVYALCRASGLAWFIDTWPALDYRQHGTNDTGARSGVAGIAKRLSLIQSGWYGSQIAAVAMLCAAVANGAERALADRYVRLSKDTRRWRGRVALCEFMLLHGRRRAIDRAVLSYAALAGHLTRTAELSDSSSPRLRPRD